MATKFTKVGFYILCWLFFFSCANGPEVPPPDAIAQEPDLIAESYYHVAKYESAVEKKPEWKFTISDTNALKHPVCLELKNIKVLEEGKYTNIKLKLLPYFITKKGGQGYFVSEGSNWTDFKEKYLPNPDEHHNVLKFNAYLYGLQLAENDHIDEKGVSIIVHGGEKKVNIWKGKFNELKYIFKVTTNRGSIYKFKNVKWIEDQADNRPAESCIISKNPYFENLRVHPPIKFPSKKGTSKIVVLTNKNFKIHEIYSTVYDLDRKKLSDPTFFLENSVMRKGYDAWKTVIKYPEAMNGRNVQFVANILDTKKNETGPKTIRINLNPEKSPFILPELKGIDLKSAKFKLSLFGDLPDDAIKNISLANLTFYKKRKEIPMVCVFDGKFIKITKKDNSPFELNEAFRIRCKYQDKEYWSKPDAPLKIGAPESYKHVILHSPDSRSIKIFLLDETTGKEITTKEVIVSYFYNSNDCTMFRKIKSLEVLRENNTDDIFLFVYVPGYKQWKSPGWKKWNDIDEDMQITMKPEYATAPTTPGAAPGPAPAPETVQLTETNKTILLNFKDATNGYLLSAKSVTAYFDRNDLSKSEKVYWGSFEIGQETEVKIKFEENALYCSYESAWISTKNTRTIDVPLRPKVKIGFSVKDEKRNPVLKALNLRVYADGDSSSYTDIVSDKRLEICRDIEKIKIDFNGNEDFKQCSSDWKNMSDIGYVFPIQLNRKQKEVIINVKDATSGTLLPDAKVQIEIDQGSPIPVPFDKFTKFFKVSAPIVTGGTMKIQVSAPIHYTYNEEIIFTNETLDVPLENAIKTMNLEVEAYYLDESIEKPFTKGDIHVAFKNSLGQDKTAKLEYNSESITGANKRAVYKKSIEYDASAAIGPRLSVSVADGHRHVFSPAYDIEVPNEGPATLQIKFANPVLYVLINPNENFKNLSEKIKNEIDIFTEFNTRFFYFAKKLIVDTEWKDKWSQAYLYRWSDQGPVRMAELKTVEPDWSALRDSVKALQISSMIVNPPVAIKTTSEFLDGFAFSGEAATVRGVLVYVLGSPPSQPTKNDLEKLNSALEKSRMLGIVIQFGKTMKINAKEHERTAYTDIIKGSYPRLRLLEMDLDYESKEGFFSYAFEFANKKFKELLNTPLH